MTVERIESPEMEIEIGESQIPNTIPSPQEITEQVKDSPRLIGCHRRGQSAIEVRIVEDGFAYRPFGSPEEAPASPWSWCREADLKSEYEVFEVDGPQTLNAILHLLRQNYNLGRRNEVLWRSMGAKSRARAERVLKRGAR